jgi:hypothetical protein
MHIKHFLLGNAIGLKLHWIYDEAYLKALSLKDDLFHMSYDPVHFQEAKEAYDSYPNQKLGDTTTQGEILKRLKALYDQKHTLTKEDYHAIILDMFLIPSYLGYQESFIKNYIKRYREHAEIILEDDHTIYFIPYVATRDLKISKALASLFNETNAFDLDLILLDEIMTHIKALGFKNAYEKALNKLELDPIYNQVLKSESIEEAVKLTGRHCSLRAAMPLVYYVCANYTLKEALYQNFLIGGSISERAGYITMILGEVESLPDVFKRIVIK